MADDVGEGLKVLGLGCGCLTVLVVGLLILAVVGGLLFRLFRVVGGV